MCNPGENGKRAERTMAWPDQSQKTHGLADLLKRAYADDLPPSDRLEDMLSRLREQDRDRRSMADR